MNKTKVRNKRKALSPIGNWGKESRNELSEDTIAKKEETGVVLSSGSVPGLQSAYSSRMDSTSSKDSDSEEDGWRKQTRKI